MRKTIARIVFPILYFLMYFSPYIGLMFLVAVFGIDLNRLGMFKQILGTVYFVCFLFLSGFRTKFALETYCDQEMRFWEAHSASGAILKTYLGFIPVVGKYFEEK